MRWVVAGALCLTPAAAEAQGEIRPHRFVAPPTVDGRVSDEEWAAVTPVPLVNLYPSFRSPLTERTEIRLGYDSDAIYASIRAWDSEPGRIRASTLERDRWESDDEFVVILDTFADGQSGAMFLVTPAGVRVDNQLTHDTEPGRGSWLNREWNVPWRAAAVRLPDGWSAEMRIPFTSLRFRTDAGRATMRVKSYRYIPRKGENQMFPETAPEAGANPHFKPSTGQAMVFDGLTARAPLHVQPYVSATSASRGAGRREWDFGGDVKWSPTPATTIDLVANADFAQVEVDQPQVNLTRFPLRFPERRPFFLERAGLFGVGLGGDDTLFHSRRVGLSAEGLPTPVYGGARFAGRIKHWDVGLLAAQEGGARPRSTAVVRLHRPAPSGLSTGLTATTQGGGADRSGALAVDAAWSRGRARVTGVWAIASGGAPWRERSRGLLRWQRDGEGGLAAHVEYRFTGRTFDPHAGFVRVRDAHEAQGEIRRTWRPAASIVRRLGWTADVSGRWRRSPFTGARASALEESRLATGWHVEWRSGVFTGATIVVSHEDIRTGFDVAPGIAVAPGRYPSVVGRVQVVTPPARALQVSTVGEAGGWYGGRRLSWRVEPVWTASAHFQAWAVVDATRISDRRDGTGAIDAIVAGARGALNAQWFADVSANRGTAGRWYGQGRIRWHRGEGQDLWIVWEFGRPDRVRAVSFKYTRLFTVMRRAR